LYFYLGGCTQNGSLIFTFTDNCNDKEIKQEHYRKAVDYFCNIPTETDKQSGFSILIDRRNDKWSSVRNVLILIQDYFPAKLNSIYILRPQSYFQRVLSSLFFQEEAFNHHNTINSNNKSNISSNSTNNQSNSTNTAKHLNIKVCKTVEDLYASIDKDQLTTDFGGLIHYRHQEWIEQRQFIEKLSSNVNECVSNLKLFIKSMEETDFPNDVATTQVLINSQLRERGELLSTVFCTRRFGETVLDVIEKTSKIDMYQNKTEKYKALTPDIRVHYQTVFNLLKLMEESELTLETFWKNHFIRLNKCLDLRKFEQKFKDVRKNLLNIHEKFNQIDDERLESEEDYENCINLLQILNEDSKNAFEEALTLYDQGIDLLITNKISNEITTSDLTDSKAANLDSNMKNLIESQQKMNLDHVNENGSETSFPESISFLRNPTVMPPPLPPLVTQTSNNNAGYCVDSVEPKCSELKRLVDEFKISYKKKLNNFKNNKIILKKLNIAKNCYSQGLKLFNDQQLINMNQEKARKYQSEINAWIHQLESTEFTSLNEPDTTDTASIESQFLSTFSTSSLCTTPPPLPPRRRSSEDDDADDSDYNNSKSKFFSNINNNNTKESKLIKNFELTCTQIKSLGSLFEKRQEQLKKIAHPTISKPVQRVEPQYIHSNNDLQMLNNSVLSTSSSSSSSSLSSNQFETMKFNSNLIKRESMQKNTF
jgi:hypothetical protein